jgi:hypothetical protein
MRGALQYPSLLILSSLLFWACEGDPAIGNDAAVDVAADSAKKPKDHGADGQVAADSRAGDVAIDGPALDSGTDNGPDAALLDSQPSDLFDSAVLLDSAPCVDPGVSLPGAVTVSPSRLVAGQTITVRYAGKLANESGVFLHYSFDNWSWKQPAGAPYKDAKQLAMTKVSGAWQVSLPIIADAHQLDFVFANQDRSAWDNNGKKDWHRPIDGLWMGPYLTWRDNLLAATAAQRDPARSIVVNFRSWRSCKARVRFGTTAGQLNRVVDETQSGHHHHLLLDNLAPNTRYHYEVGCLSSASSCFFDRSATHSFRTPPANPSAIKLIMLADPQDTNHAQDRWVDIAEALARGPHNDAHAMLIAGDLAADDEPEHWRTFFRKGAPLLSRMVLLPVVGNHDTPTHGSHANTKTFEDLFAIDSSSGKDTYYGLRIGPLTFFALNSETAQPWVSSTDWQAQNGAQYRWLEQRLAQVSTTWTFASWHIGPFNVGVRHAEQNKSTRSVLPLLDKRVDWVFSGHEHLYHRLEPLRYSGGVGSAAQVQAVSDYGTGAQDGVGYLQLPAAGHYPPGDELLGTSDPLRAMLAYPTSADITGNQPNHVWVGFSVIELSGKRFSLETYELGRSQPRDSVSYQKP